MDGHTNYGVRSAIRLEGGLYWSALCYDICFSQHMSSFPQPKTWFCRPRGKFCSSHASCARPLSTFPHPQNASYFRFTFFCLPDGYSGGQGIFKPHAGNASSMLGSWAQHPLHAHRSDIPDRPWQSQATGHRPRKINLYKCFICNEECALHHFHMV